MTGDRGAVSRKGGPLWLTVLLLAMIALGVVYRFVGVGAFGLAADEFHTAAAISYILEHGTPRFPCGGYYVRGLLYHYLLAGVSVVSGHADETLWRWVSSILSLPALFFAYLLGRRLASPLAGLVCAAILALSVWEIETARYLRMYGPFASAFLAYLYCFLACVERCTWRRLLACVAVSGIALFIHEGGAMLVALNALLWFSAPREQRFRAGLLITGLLAVAGFYMSQDWRSLGTDRLPAGLQSGSPAGGRPRIGPLELPGDLWPWLDRGGLWMLVFAVLLVASAIWVARRNAESKMVEGVLIRGVVGMLLAFHQFLLLALLPVVAWALGWTRPRAWLDATGRWGGLLILLWTTFWVTLVATSPGFEDRPLGVLRGFLDYPLVYSKLLQPWWGGLPATMVVIVAALGTSLALRLFLKLPLSRSEKTVLAVMILLVLMVAAAYQPYKSIRYTFVFLYPLFWLLICSSLHQIFGRLLPERIRAPTWLVFVAVVLVTADDFSWRHLRHIDSPDVHFRTIYEEDTGRAFWRRLDFRSPAQYINAHVTPSDLIVTTAQPSAYHLARLDAFYLPRNNIEFRTSMSCEGRKETWTGADLLFEPEQAWAYLEARGRKAWLLIRTDQYPWQYPWEEAVMRDPRAELKFTSLDGRLAAYLWMPENSADESAL